MKTKKYFNNNVFKYQLSIFIIQIIFSLIKSQLSDKCEYNPSDNDFKCKPKLDATVENCKTVHLHLEDQQCYKCEGNEDGFYQIINDGTCVNMDSCTNKIISETKECVGHCPSEYCEFGDFCYHKDKTGEYNLIYQDIDLPYKTCKCQSNKYKKKEGNKVEYECIEQGEPCGDGKFYNLDTGECVENCDEDDKIYEEEEGNNIGELRCSSECKIGEYLYEKRCYKNNCPENTYKSNITGSYLCVESCSIYDENNRACIDNCQGYIIYEKSNEEIGGIKKCKESLGDGYYEYNGIYFSNCIDTKDLFNYETYQIDGNKCIENCKEKNYFLKDKECVSNCEDDPLYPVQFNNECLQECKLGNKILYQMDFEVEENDEDIEIQDDTNQNEKYIKIEISHFPKDNICLEECPSGTYIDEGDENENKKCYIFKCKNEKYIKSDDGVLKCDSCEENNKIYSEISYLQIVKDDEEEPTNYKITRKYCLSSCPVSAPYSIGNECSNITCKDQSTYTYSAYDKPYDCYESCSSIGGGYNYEKDNICYKQQNDIKCDNYYYIDEHNVTQCTDLNYCKEHFNFIKGKQCVNECESYYKVEKGTKISTGENIDIGRCYSDAKDCKNLGLYITEDKICLDTCNYYKIEGDISVNGTNCFKNCPSNYPFKNTDDMLCKMYCPNYYYKDECLESDCKTNGTFNLIGSYECLDDCLIDGETYYLKKNDDDTYIDNVCYYSCDNPYSFIDEEENKKSKYICLKNCKNEKKFYYEKEKKCLSGCDIYNSYSSEDYICVNQCPQGKKVVIDQTENRKYYCNSSCPSGKPYTLNKTLVIPDTKQPIVEQCVEDCEGLLISNNSKYCLKECTFEEKYKYNGYCYENCPPDTLPDDINNLCYNTSEMKSKCNPNFKYIEKDVNGYYKCKKSCSENKYYLLEGPDCYDECPSGYNYSTSSKLCLTNCDKTYGEYFQKEGEYNYTCLRACDKEKYVLNDTKECKEHCPDGYFETEGNLCIKNCSLDPNNPFLKSDNKTCGKNCSEDEFYRDYEKICIKNCDDDEKKEIINSDRKCVSKCENNYYNYEEDGECVNQCKKYSYLIEKKKLCVENCIYPYNFIKGNLCVEKCNEGDYLEKIENNLTKCVDSCSNYYYETTNPYIKYNCYDKCNDKDFYIIDTNKCIESCPVPYYSYYTDKKEDSVYQNNTCVLVCPSDKPFIYNSKCVEQCVSPYNYYIEGDNTCYRECFDGTYADGYICKKYCPEDKFLDPTGKTCIDKCESPYQFYIKGVNKCIKDCSNEFFIENDTVCVNSCSDGYFLDGNICKNKCPDNKTFVDINANNSCEIKCPEEYSFYEYNEALDINICKIKCDNYSATNGECMATCNETYKYYHYKNKTCLENECPYYHIKVGDLFRCYDKCPSNYPYIMEGNECSDKCDKFINKTSNSIECQENCDYYFYEETEEDGGNKYCINKCEDLGLFLYGEKKCIKDCISVSRIPNLVDKKCECENYYSYDTNGDLVCITDSSTITSKKILYGTFQVLENCEDDKYLYYGDKYCYKKDDPLPINTEIIGNEIKCQYKSYKEKDTNTIICLAENEQCPSLYIYFIPDEKECVEECDTESYNKYGSYCLKKEECDGTNKKYFYFESETSYICVNDCPNGHEYYVDEINQCVDDCSETDYYILYNKHCYSTCDKFDNTIIKKSVKKVDENSIKYFYECVCTTDLWYKAEDGNTICNSDTSKTSCQTLTSGLTTPKPLLIKDTRECVDKCSDDYQYIFNDECFHKCEDVKKYYGYDLESDDTSSETKKCKCKGLYKSDNNIITCLEGDACIEEGKTYLEEDTKECIDNCKAGYIQFNNTCYKENCPTNSEKITIDSKNTCKCSYNWYQYEDKYLKRDVIICLGTNIQCPKEYPYYDNEAKQCLDDLSKCENKKIYNNICYDNCPENFNTIEKEGKCVCDISKGKWQKYSKDNTIVYECGLSACPKDKNYLDMDTMECLYICGNKYHYEGGCYSSCPENTVLVDEISKECVYIINFDNPKDLTSLDDKVKNNIQEIYPKTSKGGLVYNINNSTLQIYGVQSRFSYEK